MGSKSSSSQASATTSTDNRVAADNGALGITGNTGSPITITQNTSDSNLVNAGFSYLTHADASINTRSADVLNALTQAMSTTRDEITSLLGAATTQQKNASDYVSSLAQATPAAVAQSGSNNQTAIIAALIGAVAIMATSKKG